MTALEYLHRKSHELCREITGQYFSVRGCIAIFCHDYHEYEYLAALRKRLTESEPSYKGKYYPLKEPITFPEKDGIPATTYEYLYIRQVDPYRSQVGDVDFVMPAGAFAEYKSRLVTGEFRDGARVFERPEENMIELWLPEYDVASFLATEYMRDML